MNREKEVGRSSMLAPATTTRRQQKGSAPHKTPAPDRMRSSLPPIKMIDVPAVSPSLEELNSSNFKRKKRESSRKSSKRDTKAAENELEKPLHQQDRAYFMQAVLDDKEKSSRTTRTRKNPEKLKKIKEAMATLVTRDDDDDNRYSNLADLVQVSQRDPDDEEDDDLHQSSNPDLREAAHRFSLGLVQSGSEPNLDALRTRRRHSLSANTKEVSRRGREKLGVPNELAKKKDKKSSSKPSSGTREKVGVPRELDQKKDRRGGHGKSSSGTLEKPGVPKELDHKKDRSGNAKSSSETREKVGVPKELEQKKGRTSGTREKVGVPKELENKRERGRGKSSTKASAGSGKHGDSSRKQSAADSSSRHHRGGHRDRDRQRDSQKKKLSSSDRSVGSAKRSDSRARSRSRSRRSKSAGANQKRSGRSGRSGRSSSRPRDDKLHGSGSSRLAAGADRAHQGSDSNIRQSSRRSVQQLDRGLSSRGQLTDRSSGVDRSNSRNQLDRSNHGNGSGNLRKSSSGNYLNQQWGRTPKSKSNKTGSYNSLLSATPQTAKPSSRRRLNISRAGSIPNLESIPPPKEAPDYEKGISQLAGTDPNHESFSNLISPSRAGDDLFEEKKEQKQQQQPVGRGAVIARSRHRGRRHSLK